MKKIQYYFTRTLIPLIGMILFTTSAICQNTLTLQEGAVSPKADLSATAWLEGRWVGEALGGIVEEIWSPPSAGSMMSAFKLVVDDEVKFYEIVTITEENESLIFKVKHFHPNLHGWEEKDKTIDFKLVKVEDNRVYFDGLTFEQVNEKEMKVYLLIGRDGGVKEHQFVYWKE